MKMKMDNAFNVEPDGITGGIALGWSNGVKLSILHYDKNFIDNKISINGEIYWFGTFIYQPPYTEDRKKFWEIIASLQNDVNAKWCNDDAILEKLDRVLSSLEWNCLFPKAISIIDIAIALDHSPIIFMVNGVAKKARNEFKFESRWLIEEKCSRAVKEEWENKENGPSRGTFRVKLRRTRVKLSK
ncbi:hypothetical protein V6N11_053636 [Hibiscus sabdariffa]|uniref:Uncharacterized protein n=1 Tax=Hibiscus sabdariffa TaxID=183260 RepID=A0ABR2N7H7_9ROSI